MSYLKIEYWNSVDLGEVLYQDGFHNVLYLDLELEKPDYNTTIEADVNGDNQEIPKFKKWEKVYKFECWMTEDLLDAFTFMQLHDSIEITIPTGETIYVDQLRVDYEWEEVGCLAKTTVSFTENYVAAGTCTENLSKACLCEELTVVDLKMTSAAFVGFPVAVGDRAFVYSTEHITDKKFTAKVYYGNAPTLSWVEETYEVGDCLDLGITETYDLIFDGTYWQLKYGYISSLTYAAPNVTVKGWAPDGTFVTVYYDAGLGWVDGGDYIAQDLDAGILINLGVSGTIPFRLKIWNHACDYGYTETEDVIIP